MNIVQYNGARNERRKYSTENVKRITFIYGNIIIHEKLWIRSRSKRGADNRRIKYNIGIMLSYFESYYYGSRLDKEKKKSYSDMIKTCSFHYTISLGVTYLNR